MIRLIKISDAAIAFTYNVQLFRMIGMQQNCIWLKLKVEWETIICWRYFYCGSELRHFCVSALGAVYAHVRWLFCIIRLALKHTTRQLLPNIGLCLRVCAPVCTPVCTGVCGCVLLLSAAELLPVTINLDSFVIDFFCSRPQDSYGSVNVLYYLENTFLHAFYLSMIWYVY